MRWSRGSGAECCLVAGLFILADWPGLGWEIVGSGFACLELTQMGLTMLISAMAAFATVARPYIATLVCMVEPVVPLRKPTG